MLVMGVLNVLQLKDGEDPVPGHLEIYSLLFAFVLCYYNLTIENDIVYNLMVRQSVISRYVKVMQALHLFSSRFMCILGHFQL